MVLIGVRKDLFVGVYILGLTLVAVVVVEIWDEISPHRGIWWGSQWGGMVWSAKESWYGLVTLIEVVDYPPLVSEFLV